ncbi:MAG: ribosome small subunit-dependent GTPase A [Bacteroidia bacterium]|nr:ribosome small subunit-dependent GTPase A [Bacteroidia bacterium]
MNKGLVIRSTGSWYSIKSDDGTILDCRIKGKLRMKEVRTTNPIAVGDRVAFELQYDETTKEGVTGIIVSVEPRKNYIIRKASNLSRESQIIASNIDQAYIIVTVNYPVTLPGFIDRYLVSAMAYRIPATLIFNKIDLYNEKDYEKLEEFLQTYESIGYKCLQVSAEKNINIDLLKKELPGKISLFSGLSGVGKSSILNCIDPNLKLKTGVISDHHQQGKHTTTFAEMFETLEDAMIIDTPGIRGFGVIDMQKEEIAHYFPEIFGLLDQCRFFNCMHTHEPGCAVKAAAERGDIPATRYESYLSLIAEDDSRYRG